MEELEWRDIPGYYGYQVSRCGRVRSVPRTYKGRNKYVETNRTTKGKELSPRLNQHGYRIFSVSVKGVVKGILVHRAVAMAFIPNPENKATVNHKDGVRHNNHVSNLEWCTLSENIMHSHIELRQRKVKTREYYSDELYIRRRREDKWTVALPFPPFNGRPFMTFNTEAEAIAVKKAIFNLLDFDNIDLKYKKAA